jgi:hypothetical protein
MPVAVNHAGNCLRRNTGLLRHIINSSHFIPPGSLSTMSIIYHKKFAGARGKNRQIYRLQVFTGIYFSFLG